MADKNTKRVPRKKQPWKTHPKDKKGGWKGKKYTPKTWTIIGGKGPKFIGA